MKIMPLDHAILGFIDFQPMSGYDLKKFFDVSVVHFWSATQSHIYKSLELSEKMGWVEAHLVLQTGKPNRKEYQITAAGHAELRRWLTTPLAFEQPRHSWLIQIFFSQVSSNEEIAALLEIRMEHIRARLRSFRGEVQSGLNQDATPIGVERAQRLWQMTLDYGLDYYEFELAWHEKALARVRTLPPSPQ